LIRPEVKRSNECAVICQARGRPAFSAIIHPRNQWGAAGRPSGIDRTCASGMRQPTRDALSQFSPKELVSEPGYLSAFLRQAAPPSAPRRQRQAIAWRLLDTDAKEEKCTCRVALAVPPSTKAPYFNRINASNPPSNSATITQSKLPRDAVNMYVRLPRKRRPILPPTLFRRQNTVRSPCRPCASLLSHSRPCLQEKGAIPGDQLVVSAYDPSRSSEAWLRFRASHEPQNWCQAGFRNLANDHLRVQSAFSMWARSGIRYIVIVSVKRWMCRPNPRSRMLRGIGGSPGRGGAVAQAFRLRTLDLAPPWRESATPETRGLGFGSEAAPSASLC
jgi:hypothetical protein